MLSAVAPPAMRAKAAGKTLHTEDNEQVVSFIASFFGVGALGPKGFWDS